MTLTGILESIDTANANDPNRWNDRPLALVQGERASHWVARLGERNSTTPSAAVQVAARGHHLRRWEFPRSDFPAGRAGYLRWRRDAKKRHADLLGDIVIEAGWTSAERDEVERLTRRQGLGTDPDTQLVEDAACLVFLETQFTDMISRTETDKMVDVVARTMKKMSPAALALTADIALTPDEADVIQRASAL